MKKIKISYSSVALCALALVACGSDIGGQGLDQTGNGNGEEFPSASIDFIVPFPPGGGGDFTVRSFQQELQDELDISIAVENLGGGGGEVGTTQLVNREGDGYSVGLISNSAVTIFPNMRETAYDYEDLQPVALASTTRYVLQVQDDSEWNSAEEFLEYAESNPGDITYSTFGAGSIPHLAMEMLELDTGLEFEAVTYEGTGPALTALMSGEVDAAITPAVDPEEGRVRSLFSFSGERGETPEEIPLLQELGIDVGLDNLNVVMAPSSVEDDRIAILEEGLESVLGQESVIEAFAESEVELSFVARDEIRAILDEEYEMMAELLDELGLSEGDDSD
ncbi:tripartite tricarboxylate transporter substrate binding protein [Nesterenkonia ebinurensis]|uniref:tripartite tricarboxylate transporter substrate binding protein n=1 Tax=Nesterenkonia ebinurensis TaxID=2608252 RepID=UPI00123D0B60|nr:tripartite tricarboxylate transporter substrate binding protein [Nesterenkonia ebinurensis]